MRQFLEKLNDLTEAAPVEGATQAAQAGLPADRTDSVRCDLDLGSAEEDRELIDRCLAGEVDAWEELYRRCHPPLLQSIKVLLEGGVCDPNRVDEISAKVWYALIEKDGRLLARFDPRRGARAITFLRTVAKTEVRRHFRRQRRRRRRERIALCGRPAHQPADDDQTTASLWEFLDALTGCERAFYNHQLGDADRKPLSANGRQLRHRIRAKLLRFLGREA